MNIGIFGGTFNPPHMGHVFAAKAFIKECRLEKLYVIPDKIPPHKTVSGVDPETRLLMTRAAFADVKGAVVSDTELRRGGKSYTYKTLEEFKGTGELFLLCGTDMFLSFDTWMRYEEILSSCTLVLIVRKALTDGERAEIEEKKRALLNVKGAKITELISPPFPVSSSEIRELIKKGGSTGAYLNPGVSDIIEKKGLYLYD